jgi:NAD(P)-dependent dehydrogenase (short-subunit alcohol dehydrogenase family)
MVGAAEEAELPRIERLLDTNLLGSIVFAKAVIPHMRKQGGGRILQISSEQPQMAYPGMSAYATTKWGIEGFFEGVIPEIAKFGIEVTLVEPGTARTNIASSSDDTTPTEIYEDTPVGDIDRRCGADRSHARSVRVSKSLPTKSSRSPAGPNCASRAQLHPVIGLGQRTGCDADRSHGAIRPLLDVWALKSSTLERNSFRIGDLFALL